MCGIAGYVALDGGSADRGTLEKMGDAAAHRGPDGKGTWEGEGAGLSHRRLSIIDPEQGAQPMVSHDGGLALAYNGEIYNYRELRENELADYPWRTASDTEVILAAFDRWGDDCVHHLHGIFAFAVWERKRRRLFLARDHLGVKPLYWARTGDAFVFGSEIKSLLAFDPSLAKLSHKNLDLALTYRFAPSPATLFEGINKLRPGHSLAFENGQATETRYYRRPPASRTVPSENETAHMIEQAVKRQLVADVPVGVLLSGGLDSSLLAAHAARHYGKELTAFTVGYRGDHSANEFEEAEELARHLGIRHERVVIDHIDFLSVMDRVAGHLEEPSATSSMVPLYLLCETIRKTHKVVLSGQGVDETWAGYFRYAGEAVGSSLRPLFASRLMRKAVSFLPRAERIKRGFYALGETDDLRRFVKIYSLFNRDLREELLNDWCEDDLAPLAYYRDDTEGMDPLAKLLYLDVRVGLPDDLLLYTDKMSMAHSVEVRVPYLDRELVEHVESLPTPMKMKYLKGKQLFRKIAAAHLPPSVLTRPKVGFETPVDAWFQKELTGEVRGILCGADSRIGPLFRKGALEGMVDRHATGSENYSKQLFMLLSLELWAKKFGVTV